MKTLVGISKNIKTTINSPDQTFPEADTAIFSASRATSHMPRSGRVP